MQSPVRVTGASAGNNGAVREVGAIRAEVDALRDEARRLRSELASVRKSIGGDTATGSATGIATMAMAALGVLLGLFALFHH